MGNNIHFVSAFVFSINIINSLSPIILGENNTTTPAAYLSAKRLGFVVHNKIGLLWGSVHAINGI